jgi:hypothetical protein
MTEEIQISKRKGLSTYSEEFIDKEQKQNAPNLEHQSLTLS